MPYSQRTTNAEKQSGGDSINPISDHDGFSLIEILVALLINSILIGLFLTNYPSLKSMTDRFLERTVFEEKYLIFLIKLQDHYQQSELISSTDVKNIDQMEFKIDRNLDGDYNDSAERISYNWNPIKLQVEQARGADTPKAILEGVNRFSWERISDVPFCYRIELTTLYRKLTRKMTFCRNR